MAYERNLILVHTPRRQALSDFETVREKIAERAPDIEVFIVGNGAAHADVCRRAAGRPTLVFSPMGIETFAAARGKVFGGNGAMTKSEQIRRLALAGVPVPDTVLLEAGIRLDPRRWGPAVVVKPEIGKRGDGVRLMSTETVRRVDPRSWPEGDPRRGHECIAQRFIDTGPHARSYRVMTVFGRPVYSNVSTQFDPRAPLDPSGDAPIDEPVASNAGRRTIAMNFETDVIDLARQTWRAVPEVAVHGVDILREAATGRLYVIEINPSGRTWHISSDFGLPHQREFGLDYAAQFGALDIVADALIEATRREAE